jgi:hypothetical protein
MAKNRNKTKMILAEVNGVAGLLKAAQGLRDAGYKDFDCHAPFAIHGLNQAMGIKRSNLGFIVGAFAAIGLIGTYLMAYWMSSVDYPLLIALKPFNSYPAYTPVIFAIAVLFAAFSTFLGMLALNKLPRFHHPLFASQRFDKFSDDGFFVSINATDPQFDSEKTPDFLTSIGCKNLEVIEE